MLIVAYQTWLVVKPLRLNLLQIAITLLAPLEGFDHTSSHARHADSGRVTFYLAYYDLACRMRFWSSSQ